MSRPVLDRTQIAARIARELAGAATIRLGRAVPTELANSVSSAKLADNGTVDVAVAAAAEVSAAGGLRPAAGDDAGVAAGARRLLAVMSHVDTEGRSCVVDRLSAPGVAGASVERIFTDWAVIDVTADGLILRELAPKVSAKDVQQVTASRLLAGPDLKPLALDDNP